jgi:hypothetical protein
MTWTRKLGSLAVLLSLGLFFVGCTNQPTEEGGDSASTMSEESSGTSDVAEETEATTEEEVGEPSESNVQEAKGDTEEATEGGAEKPTVEEGDSQEDDSVKPAEDANQSSDESKK